MEILDYCVIDSRKSRRVQVQASTSAEAQRKAAEIWKLSDKRRAELTVLLLRVKHDPAILPGS